ncbi:hypothetical protein RRF57_003939 [Xylaria bambusicola]|uniref:Uncharacterized protein n=1 Tax=Xylaria bambusicola TaxID=326684 RepID=A0AAN7UGG7_9PEZI
MINLEASYPGSQEHECQAALDGHPNRTRAQKRIGDDELQAQPDCVAVEYPYFLLTWPGQLINTSRGKTVAAD